MQSNIICIHLWSWDKQPALYISLMFLYNCYFMTDPASTKMFFPLISGNFLFRLWKGCCNACWSHMTLTCHSGRQVRCYDSIRCTAHCHTSYLTIVLWVNGFLVHPLSLALELPTSYLRMLIGSIFYASLIMFPACLQFVFRPTEIGCQGERCSQILLLKVCLLPRNWEKLGI